MTETFRPGACMAELSRRHGLHPQQFYIWRRHARRGELVLQDEDLPMFAPVVAAAPAGAEAAPHLLMLELGEVRHRIRSAVSPERVAALVAALRAG